MLEEKRRELNLLLGDLTEEYWAANLSWKQTVAKKKNLHAKIMQSALKSRSTIANAKNQADVSVIELRNKEAEAESYFRMLDRLIHSSESILINMAQDLKIHHK